MAPRSDPEAVADQLLRQLGYSEPPIPVERVVKHLGLKLEPAELGEDVSGILVVAGDRGLIGVNSAHADVRQRFSIAHEIGHFMLHRTDGRLFIDKQYFTAFRDTRSSTGEHRRERQANAFAAALLMPKRMLQKRVDRKRFDLADDSYLEGLADLFQVSKQAITYRVANLGLLSD